MNFSRGSIKSSPYLGVFCAATDDICLVPHSIVEKELKILENTLGVMVVKTRIGNSALIGALARGLGRKFAVSSITQKEEIQELENLGLEVLQMRNSATCTGNLLALNRNGAIASPLVLEKEIEELNTFFGAKFVKMAFAGNDLAGSSITVTNKGFICHPDVSREEFEKIAGIFGVTGKTTTANFGDLFVANSVIANTKGAVVGANTSGIELSKIDEGLRGD